MSLRSRDRHILLLIFLLHVVKQGIFAVEGATDIKGIVGEDALFMWNITSDRKILSVLWGIKSGNLANPQFIHVSGNTGNVSQSTELDLKYKGRVEYFGNLTSGHAWFKLKNLTFDDANWYIASITDHMMNISPYYVYLRVTAKVTTVKLTESTTTSSPNMTISTTTSPTKTPTTTPTTAAPTTTALTQTPSPLHWIIPMIVIGVIVMVVVIVIIFCYCCYKGMCKCCWCKSCMCVPFLCPKRKGEEGNKTDDNESGGVVLQSASQEKGSEVILHEKITSFV